MMNKKKLTHGQQVLKFQGLRFDSSLGILPQEHKAPQPIRVDAQLNLGQKPMAPEDDAIYSVLDYRKVRALIIETCTRQHLNLLESLIGEVANALMTLPGVLGVKVKITKLEIFEDCEVAIEIQAGDW